MPKLTEEEWNAAKRDRLAGISYRDLASKYNISTKCLFQKAKKEGWDNPLKVKDTIEKAVVEVHQNEVSSAAYDSAKQLFECADLLAQRIAQALQVEVLRPSDYKALSGALKDIRDIKDIKSERDIREQEARISKLIKEADTESSDTSGFGVFVLPSVKELKKPSE